MSESRLDQIVKGAPPPNVNPQQTAAAVTQHERRPNSSGSASINTVTDPTTLVPSSPPQIYLNLLILEASLRSQYLTLRARRRQNTFVLIILTLWIAFFSYLLFLRPREDGKGVGGSVYWVVDMAEKVAWMGGMMLGVLFWGTGQWERGVRWPRRWVGIANRGLRGMNCKVVVEKGPWWREIFSYLAFLNPYNFLYPSPGSSYHFVDYSDEKHVGSGVQRHSLRDQHSQEEDIAPGGDHIRLMLLAKPFSADFRQNWEVYREEYWERENERRALLRQKVRLRERELAKAEGGWLWWTGWRGWKKAMSTGDDQKHLHPHAHAHHTHAHSHSRSASITLKDKKRRPSLIKEGSRSRSSSRSSNHAFDSDGRSADPRERRWSNSTAGSTSEKRRSKLGSSGVGMGNSARPTRMNSGSRPTTPNDSAGNSAPALDKRASMLSTASSGTESEKVLVDEKFLGRGAPAA